MAISPSSKYAFRVYTSKLEMTGARARPWKKLRAPAIVGNIAHALVAVAEWALARDLKPACAMLYGLLMRNTDGLAVNPAYLQKPDTPASPLEQTQARGVECLFT